MLHGALHTLVMDFMLQDANISLAFDITSADTGQVFDIIATGCKELEILINHYGQEKKEEDVVSKSLIDADQVRQEWALCNEIVMQ